MKLASILFSILFSNIGHAANATPASISVVQKSSAPCSLNNVINYTNRISKAGVPGDEVIVMQPVVINTPNANCSEFQKNAKSTKLNELESAQLKLLMAQNPSGIKVENLILAPVLGQSTASLWILVSNLFPMDAYNLRTKLNLPGNAISNWNEKNKYMSTELPGALITGPITKIPHDGKIQIQIANSEDLKALLPQPIDQWCLYDVHVQANDRAIDGFAEAEAESLRSLNGIARHSFTRVIGLAFEVSHEDIFNVRSGRSVIAYLRFASRNSTHVFYPSIKCISFDLI